MISDKSIFEEIEGTSPLLENENIENENVEKGIKLDMGFLTVKTGEGSIEEYIDHPLNFNKGRGMAQVIRGFTGLFGALDLALIDILVGILQFSKERKAGVDVAN